MPLESVKGLKNKMSLHISYWFAGKSDGRIHGHMKTYVRFSRLTGISMYMN